MSDLLPCPWCPDGGKLERICSTVAAKITGFYIWCESCDAEGPVSKDGFDGATALWNRRSPPAPAAVNDVTQGWIAVGERHPAEPGIYPVLVVYPDGTGAHESISRWDHEHVYWATSWRVVAFVDRPLPPPPDAPPQTDGAKDGQG